MCLDVNVGNRSWCSSLSMREALRWWEEEALGDGYIYELDYVTITCITCREARIHECFMASMLTTMQRPLKMHWWREDGRDVQGEDVKSEAMPSPRGSQGADRSGERIDKSMGTE